MTYETDTESHCDPSSASQNSSHSQSQAVVGSLVHPGSRDVPCGGSRELGKWGENYAADYLRAQGWMIRERNWHCRGGELDLIVLDPDGVLVAVEVKTRSQSFAGYAAEAITAEKLQRVRRTLATYLSTHTQWYATIRIDVIAIDCSKDGAVAMQHIRGENL